MFSHWTPRLECVCQRYAPKGPNMKYFPALILALTPTLLMSHDYTIGGLKIDHPVARATTPTARTSAGYMTIKNVGETADTLLAVEADFPRVELHTTTVTAGVASMQKLEAVEIPMGATVTFEQGGLHVMIMGVTTQLMEGDTVPAVLVFENAGRIDVDFNVEQMDGSGHGHMNH